MQEKNAENMRLEKTIALLDKEAKALHDHFTQNKDIIERLFSITYFLRLGKFF